MSDGVSFTSEWGLGKLSLAERRLCEAFTRADEVDLRTGDPEKDDPQHGDKWGGARRVRAEVIAALLLSDVRAAPGRVAAVRLTGARVTGALSLIHAEVRFPLLLEECWFEQPICLDEAAVRTVSLAGSVIPGLDANDTKVDGHLLLNACRMQRVALTDARITGQLEFTGARLTNPGGQALTADRLVVEGSIFCREGFQAEGEISLAGARITGELGFVGARLINPGGTALNCVNAEAGSLWLRAGFAADGEVDLSGARVGTLYDDPDCWPSGLKCERAGVPRPGARSARA